MYVCMYVCLSNYLFVYLFVCLSVCLYVCMYVAECLYVCICAKPHVHSFVLRSNSRGRGQVANLFVRFWGSRNSFRLSYETIPKEDHTISFSIFRLRSRFFGKVVNLFVRSWGTRLSDEGRSQDLLFLSCGALFSERRKSVRAISR